MTIRREGTGGLEKPGREEMSCRFRSEKHCREAAYLNNQMQPTSYAVG